MSKKVIGALLALVMVLSVFSLSVFAYDPTSDETAADAAKYTQTWSLSTPELVSGSTYKVKVYLKTNYLVGPVQFKLNNVSGATAALGSGYYTGSTISCGANGLVLLTPSTSATLVGEKFETAREIAVVTYTKGSADPVIENLPKTKANPTGTLFATRLSGSTAVNSANFVFGQTVVIDGQTPTPPAGNVTLTGKNAGVVDNDKGYVYGIPVDSDPTDYFTTTGYIEVAENDQGKTCATGAKLNLYDKQGGSLVKSYTIIIFGDVNGDAVIDGTDALEVEKIAYYVNDEMELGDIGLFAAEVNNDGSVDGTDALDIEKFAFYVNEYFTVNPYA